MIEAISNKNINRLAEEADCIIGGARIGVHNLFIVLDTLEVADEPPMYCVALYTMLNGHEAFDLPHERIRLSDPFKFVLCGDECEAMHLVSELMSKRSVLSAERFNEWLEEKYPLLSE